MDIMDIRESIINSVKNCHSREVAMCNAFLYLKGYTCHDTDVKTLKRIIAEFDAAIDMYLPLGE